MTSFKPVSLAYKIFKASHDVEEDNPIIFLHGLGASKEHWMDIPQKIADATHRMVYVVDARNHGDSEWSKEFNSDLNTLDLEHFIENKIKAEKITLVGHSMGGISSMKTALKMPSKINKIIVEDVGIVIPKEIMGIIKFLLSLYQEATTKIPAGSTKEEAARFLGEFVFQRLPDEVKTFIRIGDNYYQELIKQNPDGSFTSRSNLKVLINALDSDSLISEYEGVYDGPACFIYGEKSVFPVSKDAKNIQKFFPNAQFVGIEDATHDVHTDAPLPYTEALLKFLKE